jgi:2-iminobutanoate/2-iminopropanoate deaminase
MHTRIDSEAPTPELASASEAQRVGRLLICSGKVADRPRTSEMTAGDVRREAIEVMKNLEATLAKSGASFSQVVKGTIFLTDPGDFARVNSVYGSFFDGLAQPASSTVQVSTLAREARVEIELIAVV